MRIVADLHIHSRFSRACSKALTLPAIAAACVRKGIALVATGDWTHPQWRAEIGEQLEEVADGVFKLRDLWRHQKIDAMRSAGASSERGVVNYGERVAQRSASPEGPQFREAGFARSQELRTARDLLGSPKFLLGTELSCIYKDGGKVRRVHHLVLVPSLSAADRIIAALERRGCNLRADGRPILGVTSRDLLAMALEADPRTLLIPAHAWTPWFAVFGSESGYDALAECFGDLTPHVPAIETGLSSDPAMNWRVTALDDVALISSSDAHSLEKLGREATVLEISCLTFDMVVAAIRASAPCRYNSSGTDRIVETIEFFPEEGKYHFDGHRLCGVRMSPVETQRHRGICPQCAKSMTVGVMHRVDKLANRPEGFVSPHAPTFRRIVPLDEVVADAFGVVSITARVRAACDRLLDVVGSEFHILLDAPLDAIATAAPPEIVEAIRRVRAGRLDVAPGYDGTFGTVRIFTDAAPRPVAAQHALF